MAIKHIIYRVPNQGSEPPFVTPIKGVGGWSYGTIEEEDLIRSDVEVFNILEISSEESSSLRWYGCVNMVNPELPGFLTIGNIGSDAVVSEEDKLYMPNEITGSVVLFMKKLRKKDVERHYDKKFQLLNVQNFPGEKSTWEQQYNEASEYIQDTDSATPMLSLLAQKRGITVGTLAQSVISKRDAYISASADILGSQQAERDAIDNLTTIPKIRKYHISGSIYT